MTTLNYVLKKLDFSESARVGIVQALIYSSSLAELSEKDENHRHFQKASFLQELIPSEWRAISVEDVFNDPSIAEIILNHEFETEPSHLFDFLIGITQIRMLGEMDFAKGGHNRSELNEYEVAAKHAMEIIANLGMFIESRWNENSGKISSALVHGMTEKGVRARLEHLLRALDQHGDESIDLYYLTNPRGLFNFEDSTSIILSQWFSTALGVEVDAVYASIRETLKASQHSWLKNLPLLKEEIVNNLRILLQRGDIEWPETVDYICDSIFDEAAKLEKRESMGNWPNATHMVKELVSQIYPEDLARRINVIPVNVMGHVDKSGRFCIANTIDTLEAFRDRFSDNLKGTLAVVTDNSVSHGAIRQKYLTDRILNDIPHQTIFDSVDQSAVNIKTAFEQLAKTLYAMQEAKPFLQADNAVGFCNISGNRSSLVNNFGTKNLDEQKEDVKYTPMKMSFNG